jgi:signal transduction histidine kinase
LERPKKLPFRIKIKKDEIGTLSRSMKQMRVDLRARNDKLRTLAIELNKQKNELIEANKSKDDFLANMSHELKTPLNSINVISAVMMKNRKGELNEDHVKNLSIINNCGNDLLFLINDVLDISKLEAGEVELNYETIPFGEMMTRIKDMIEPQVKAKSLNFVYECDTRVEFIYSDRNRIKQIIKNLLSNALKFTAKGNITLKALLEGQSIKISVEDEGIGIPQEKLEHIFDRFKQVDGTTTRNYGGTGLGLAICKELTSLLGGDISVSSTEGKGTTFTVMIPMNKDKVDVPEHTASQEAEEKTVQQEPQPLNHTATVTAQMKPLSEPTQHEEAKETTKTISNSVLLLNNDPLSFMSAVIDLNKHMSVSQVNSSEQALNKLQQSAFDVVILDLKDVEDKELDAFLAQPYHKMILVYDKNNEPQAQIKSKVTATFEKPFDKNAFIEEIKS